MLARWAGGTEGNLFPLCGSKAFKRTFEESMNKRHSFGSSRCPRASKNRKHQYKIPSHCFERKALRNYFGDCKRNIFYYLDGEAYTLLDWNPRVQLVVQANSNHGQGQ